MMPMRTLWGERIHCLDPPPTPSPSSNYPGASPHHPLDLVFHSSVASSSTGSSPYQNDWLNSNHWQLQRSGDGPETSFSHGQETPHAVRRRGSPSIAFMGARRCGKSSIRKVVYEKLSPADTLYLEPTTKIESTQMPGFVHIHGYEIPGNLPLPSSDNNNTTSSDYNTLLSTVGAVVWVIDCQDEYFSSIRQLLELAVHLAVHHPRINLSVFVHKTDGLTDEYKNDAFREIRQRVQDELSDSGFADRAVSYYQTSIFDHSIFEAMSKVVQRLLPQVPALETLLTRLCSTCRIQKAYLFDTVSRIYVATDSSPTFLKDYEVASEYVDMVVDIKQIYGWRGRDARLKTAGGDTVEATEEVNDGQQRKQPQPQPLSDDDDGDAIAESVISFEKTGDTYMYAREVDEFLSIVCILGRGSSADKKVLIDYNTSVVHDALVKIFDL